MQRRRRSRPTAERKGRRDRLDPYELAILRAADTTTEDPDAPEDAPPPLPRLRIGHLRVGPLGLLVGIALIVAMGSLVRLNANRAPELPPSCTQSGLALSSTTVPRGGLVRWTAVGPDREVVLALDAASLSADLRATPLAGRSRTQVVPQPVRLTSCRATGRFGVQLPPGDHQVGVFPASGGPPLVTKRFTVSER